MKDRTSAHLILIVLLALASPGVAAPSPTLGKPRLVLQITVDHLRGDLPTRYADRLGEGGLRYLLEEGIHYNNAHHAHAAQPPTKSSSRARWAL